MLRDVARALWAPHDIVEVNREVEGQAEAGRVRRGEGHERMPVRELVGIERRLAELLTRIQTSQLGKVPIVVASPDGMLGPVRSLRGI